MRKRVKLNSYEPLVCDKNMKFVARSWYNKIFPFVKPFEFLKRNKNFQCSARKTSDVIADIPTKDPSAVPGILSLVQQSQ